MDRFFNNNLVLRIVAIVLACILWFTVNAPQTAQNPGQSASGVKDFPYAVHVNLPQDMMVTEIDHPTVVIEVKGNLVNTSSLPSAMMGVEVVADATGLSPGKHALTLKALNMPAAEYSIIPQTVNVTLEKKVTASKPVQIHVSGTPAKGYQVGQVQPDVDTVQVSGVSSAVSRVVAVTADISVKGAKTTVSHTLTLQPVDKNGNAVTGVEVDPINVTTVVHIEPPQVGINLTPEIFGTPAPGYAVSGISLAQASVNVTAPPDVTAKLTNINLPVDVSGLKSTTTLDVPIVPQAGWTHVDPGTVQVTVDIAKSASRTFTKVPLQVLNVPPGLTVTLGKPNTLDIRVSGPAPVISQLQTSDITAYIDASKLSTNDTSALVTVSVPDFVTVTQMSQTTVALSVQSTNVSNNAAGNQAGTNSAASNTASNSAANNTTG